MFNLLWLLSPVFWAKQVAAAKHMKGIKWNLKGEGRYLGGLVIVNGNGVEQFKYAEKTIGDFHSPAQYEHLIREHLLKGRDEKGRWTLG